LRSLSAVSGEQQNPDLAQLLGQAQVTPGGDRVTLRMSLSDDQWRVHQKNSCVKM